MPAENQPEAYISLSKHACIHSYLMHHIQSSYKTIPYTLNIGYRSLTSQLQQNGINRARQPLTKILVRLYEGQKKPAKKNPFGEKIRQEIWVGTIAQTLSSLQPILRGFTLQPK